MSERPAGYHVGNLIYVNGWSSGYKLVHPDVGYATGGPPAPADVVIPLKPSSVDAAAVRPSRAGIRGTAAHISATAIHEAGHIVMALAVGRHVISASVDRASPGNGVTRRFRAPLRSSLYSPEDGPGSALAAWLATKRRVEDDIAISLAGPLAEAKALGVNLRALGALSDLEHALDRADYLQSVSKQLWFHCKPEAMPPHEMLNAIRKRTRRWVGQKRVWTMICALARRLEIDTELDDSAIHQVIGDTTGESTLRGFGF